MDSPIIRGSEIELHAQRARNIAYRKWCKRINTDIDRREQQRVEDEQESRDLSLRGMARRIVGDFDTFNRGGA